MRTQYVFLARSHPSRSKRSLARRALISFFTAATLLPASSCIRKKTEIAPPPQADRMLQAYSEIQSGRLLILADFEHEKQMAMFQFESASNPGRMAREPKSGRPETGDTALSVTFAAPGESVLISSPKQGAWLLKRDWRSYDLLMMAVRAASPGITLRIKVVGGVSGHAVETVTDAPLHSGWNLLRFDLIELGEQVPLDDIQEIRLSLLDTLPNPVTLHFDDFLLAGNRRDLLGDPAADSGKLYVQSAGRHWNVGAGGRFEISFRNGQITRWFNLKADPYRLRNLVRGTSLGPAQVRLAGDILEPAWDTNAISVRQRILEMNEIRVVIECLLQSGADNAAYQHVVYTIYPTGQIYVAGTSSAVSDQAPILAVQMAWTPQAPEVQLGGAGTDSRKVALARATSVEGDAGVLFIPYADSRSAHLQRVNDETNRVTSLVWQPSEAAYQTSWQCHLVLGSASELSGDSGQARALDYVFPFPGSVRTEIGRPANKTSIRSDGFDPGSGSFMIATEDHRARIVIDGRRLAVFSPVFEVDGQSPDQAWVYVNYILHQPVHRDPKGRALFQIPETVTRRIVVEPLFKTDQPPRP